MLGQGRIHYAWFILVACIGFYSLTIGIYASTQGVFYAPVMAETGWSRTEATLFTAIQPLVSAAFSVFAGRVLERHNPRWVLVGCVVLFGVAYTLPAFVNTLWMWAAYGVAYGFSMAFILYLAVPTLVNRWFVKRNGLAIGIVSAGTSVFAAIGNPVVAALIQAYGWHVARVQVGVAVGVVAVVMTALFVRSRPSDMGLRPYGAEASTTQAPSPAKAVGAGLGETAGTAKDEPPKPVKKAAGPSDGASGGSGTSGIPGVTAARAVKSPAFYYLMVCCSAFVICTTLCQQLASYGAETELGATVGAFAVSLVSGVAVFSKIGLGWLCDKAGVSVAAMISCASGVVSVLLMLVAGTNPILFLVAAAIFGIGYSSMTVLSPISVREAFGLLDYPRIYSRITSVVFIVNSVGNLLYAVIYDLTGGYAGMFVLAAVLYGMSFFLLPKAVRVGKKLQRTQELEQAA